MGIRDSSKTRVVPVFDFLLDLDKTGHLWLPKLLRLPIGGSQLCLPPDCDLSIQDRGWGDNEKKLDPPVALLSWLIRHPQPLTGQLSSDPIKAQKRRELIEGKQTTVIEALGLLRKNPKGEDWHIFEGETQPDVFIQTPSLLIVIEGKRTEREPTTSTKWMAGRHQMLRHIDCAWEIRGRKQVVGFFIVEGEDKGGEAPHAWLDYAKDMMSSGALAARLPHRGPEEQKEIGSCFIGVTTWGRTCRKFAIPPEVLLETTE